MQQQQSFVHLQELKDVFALLCVSGEALPVPPLTSLKYALLSLELSMVVNLH
jgi:hypothetical protein